MAESRGVLLNLNLPCDRHAPGAVRKALDESTDMGWGLGDAMLVASELVTNAVMHSGCREDQEIEVQVSIRSGRLLIMVCDPGLSGQDARVRENEPIGGWGLRLVDQLAQAWGSSRAGGHRVWAEVAVLN